MRGISFESIGAIERQLFEHFVSLEYLRSGAPRSWPSWQRDLEEALVAAFALNTRWSDRDPAAEDARIAEQRRRATMLVTEVAEDLDPLEDWDRFREALWDGRSRLREERPR